MRKHEIELIAALAEGRLEDETEARALVDSSEGHRSEYEAQKTAFETLHAVPAAQLTEHESAALRRDVWTQLRAEPTQAAAPVPWYYRWTYAAAGLFVVIGLVIVVDQTNPNFAPTALLSSDDSAADSFSATQERASSDDGATDTTESVAGAGADQETADAAEGDVPAVAGLTAPTIDELTDLAGQTRRGELKSFTLGAVSTDQELIDEMTLCVEAAGLSDHDVVGDVEVEHHYIVAAPARSAIGPETPIAFVDADICELAYTDQSG